MHSYRAGFENGGNETTWGVDQTAGCFVWNSEPLDCSQILVQCIPLILEISRILCFPKVFSLLYGELRTANLAQNQEKPRKNNISQDISRMRGIH